MMAAYISNRGTKMRHSQLPWIILSGLILTVGCAKQQYGECSPPNDELQILFKAKVGVNLFSHSFCIACNPSLEPEEYMAWAGEMGANMTPDMDTPCLYVYGADDIGLPNGYESLAQCQAAVCEGGATYADFVSRRNGNIDLDPIIGPAEEE
jgi:hypothetical protein